MSAASQPTAAAPTPARTATELLRALARGSRAERRANAAKLVANYLLVRGGAWPQDLYDSQGDLLARQPLWGETARAQCAWHLSAACAQWAEELEAAASLEDRQDETEPALSTKPLEPLDVVFWQALADRLEQAGSESLGELVVLRAASQNSPLAALELDPAVPLDRAALGELLLGNWLPAYLGTHWMRRWLQIDGRRGWLSRAREHDHNLRQAALFEWLSQLWREPRPEHLRILVRYLARRLALGDGPAGIVRVARRGDWSRQTTAQREAFEAGVARPLGLGGTLAAWAEELRGLGWQRTPAEEAFVGACAQDLDPVRPVLDSIWRELSRLV